MLRTATPEQIKNMFCEIHDNCYDDCPSFIRERCGVEKNGFLAWLNEEAIAPKDAPKDVPKGVPKGWVKLQTERATDKYIYINASTIAGLRHAMNAVSGEITSVYTIGRSSPWHVYGSIDEIMGKIERA
jgi:hypothetical protein